MNISSQGVTGAASNKLAMSRALGAAFLTHQVEQLEKSVSADQRSHNWRDRKSAAPRPNDRGGANGRAGFSPGEKRGLVPVGGIKVSTKKRDGERDHTLAETKGIRIRKREDDRREQRQEKGKDADIIVLDASVLVNALGQVKKWCRDGREEILIVPLEALNTLDLLKKGSSQLAQRARAASRVLEAQVGSNPRVRVQQDSAFVLWDSIPWHDLSPEEGGAGQHPLSSPEWVRRTICCAQWEMNHAVSEVAAIDNSEKPKPPAQRVVLATLSQAAQSDMAKAAGPVSESPVPLPAPHANKHEPRATGALVSYWATRAKLDVLQVNPTSSTELGGRSSEEEERDRRKRVPVDHGLPRGRKNSNTRAVGYGSDRDKGGGIGGGGLVERPPAVKAMMEIVAQPSKVVRVLARGEKLDP
ncbi:hypothetical protein BV25DRAFT_1799491 [Artomyces pyxidatus]|uniref:Uncharacterized protein n=1 Tax=Artomyces pyxidatus TaxID=48021 RepID=A0ACB8T9X5_9AGAM|nr:hypothetical protein BV25DRAFT_1799491 [Artomyces pyxidatus]